MMTGRGNIEPRTFRPLVRDPEVGPPGVTRRAKRPSRGCEAALSTCPDLERCRRVRLRYAPLAGTATFRYVHGTFACVDGWCFGIHGYVSVFIGDYALYNRREELQPLLRDKHQIRCGGHLEC